MLRVCAHLLSCVQLFVTPWTVTLCPWNFPGKNTGGVAISSSRGSSWPRDQTWVSWISCISKQILYRCATRESLKQYWTVKFQRSLCEVRKGCIVNPHFSSESTTSGDGYKPSGARTNERIKAFLTGEVVKHTIAGIHNSQEEKREWEEQRGAMPCGF